MSKTIEMQFDEEMLEYIQDLQLKTVKFGGYDREDVYAQIRALINKAREVCSTLTEHAVSEAERGMISNFGAQRTIDSIAAQGEFFAADYPDANSMHEEIRIAESTIEALQRELQAVETEANDARTREQNAVKALNQEKLDYQKEFKNLQNEITELKQQYEDLQKHKSKEEQRQETMEQASAILREARLEGARLIDDSRAKIDQEILLGRALRNEEESKAKKDIAVLTEELEELVGACLEHREYLRQSKTLLTDVLEFAETGEDMAAAALERSNSGSINTVLDRYKEQAEADDDWQEKDEYWQPDLHHEEEPNDDKHSKGLWHSESDWQPEELIHSEEDRQTEDDILEGLSYEEDDSVASDEDEAQHQEDDSEHY